MSWREVEAWRHIVGLEYLKRGLEAIGEGAADSLAAWNICRGQRQAWSEPAWACEESCVSCGWESEEVEEPRRLCLRNCTEHFTLLNFDFNLIVMVPYFSPFEIKYVTYFRFLQKPTVKRLWMFKVTLNF